MRDQLVLIRTAIIIGYRKGTKVGEYSERKENLTESSARVSLDTHVHDHRFMAAKIGNQPRYSQMEEHANKVWEKSPAEHSYIMKNKIQPRSMKHMKAEDTELTEINQTQAGYPFSNADFKVLINAE